MTRDRGTREHHGGGLRGAIAAEWTKLWTVRTTYVCVIAAFAFMAVFTFYYGSIARINDHPLQPVGNAPVAALVLVQYPLAVLAMTSVTSEYTTGSARTTLQWVPLRHRAHLAKAVVAAVVALVLGFALGVVGMAVAWVVFDGHATFAVAEAVYQVLAMGAYLALVSVIAIGVSFALRAAAGVLAVLFFSLTASPIMLVGLGGEVLSRINEFLPQTAGSGFMLGDAEPHPPLVAFLIVVAWAGITHFAGLAVLRERDA
ncbi:ABC transporter permease [Actinokineospora pegani]|uniref:ABC transporter permease n=1 Tax=Actinokineospora pegani TaxID=2654637 RepID=UPI0012E9A3F5|nr:ABC transporter permease [Actinokineospora pegani]